MDSAVRSRAIEIVAEVAVAIKALRQVPEGHLYAQLMGFMSLDGFNSVLDILVKQGYITISNHLITWVKD